MGIPGLYRWLVDRYPSTLCCVAEERSRFSHGPTIDSSTPNPNGVEFDNLYIDMNGVIHPCFHPEGLPAPQAYDAVLSSIFRYIERVFSIVRPRKLLFLAVDGVAPRAKMNHQRIRRFRAAREAACEISAVEVEGDKKLDSNVITPGTEFMDLLSSALQYYVHLRMNSDAAWGRIKVVLSDSTVVGEGEHKILSYIRSQRNLPGYDPNTRHCFHGLDADLIMLALATHEIHVSILREVITYGNHMKRDLKAGYPRSMKNYLDHLKFEFFNIWVLREYLERELLPNVQGTDFERLIDDFVFICLFVGNDFLPHLPSLDIAEGGIEILLIVYQKEFAKMGYLTDSSKVNLKGMEHFLQALSSHETAIFMKRAQENRKRKRSSFQDSVSDAEIHNKSTKPMYYTRNFDCERHDIDRIKRDAVLRYTEGVCWIMHYYYQGVCSWQWFYPYHYAPFASDFCGLDKMEIHFTLGQPLKPLDQLLGVLPAASAQALPLSYRELMTKESSPILDFFPKDAKIDKNGKKHAWQGVCKLPFIEEARLLSEIVKVEHTLTAEEKQRNKFGRDRLLVHELRHPLGTLIKDHHPTDPSSELEIQINPGISGGMNGYLCISDKPVCPLRIPSPVDGKHIERNRVNSVDYKCPSYAPHVPKLLSGVIMPPKILRSQDGPPPLPVWHIASESPTQESGKKKRKGEEANTLQPDGKLVAHIYFVEDSVGEKSNSSANQQQQMMVGTQRDVEGRDEKWNIGVREHQGLEVGEQRKQEKKRLRQAKGKDEVCENTEEEQAEKPTHTENKKKRGGLKLEGEEDKNKEQEKTIASAPQVHMIDDGEEKTHGILDRKVALVEEEEEKINNVEVGANKVGVVQDGGRDNKRKKQKKSKSALGLGDVNGFEAGEKTNKEEQEIVVDMVVEEEKGKGKGKGNEEQVNDMERNKHKRSKHQLVGTTEAEEEVKVNAGASVQVGSSERRRLESESIKRKKHRKRSHPQVEEEKVMPS